jgi:N4-(beta-N-acetylglucosaminyl)-L-asparaginase
MAIYNRRHFFGRGLAGAVAASMGLVACRREAAESSVASGRHNPHARAGVPLAIATWAPNVKATQAAMEILARGSRALDAVEAGARVPEADPEDNSVGYGGYPDRDGRVTLDACIMDEKGNAGSVSFLEHIMHPVSVARKVMEETPHVMLSGEGALQFAMRHGFKKENLLTEAARVAWREWLAAAEYQPLLHPGMHDTIGILAIDAAGDIAGACSTSGVAFKYHGRVGDSPIIGAGMFVDNEVGGACATGWGELAMRTLGSFLIVEIMRRGATPQEACEEAVDRILKKYRHELVDDFGVGYLAVNKAGEHGAFSVGPNFTYALYQGEENRALEAASRLS